MEVILFLVVLAEVYSIAAISSCLTLMLLDKSRVDQVEYGAQK
jgi:hypothetical protein